MNLAAVSRARLWPEGTVSYSMSNTDSPTGHRRDCSGFVSMCWNLPTPGENTESLVTKGIMVEIQPSSLGAGDAIGICGPGSLGAAGHIMLVQAVRPTGIDIIEQAGGQFGPIHRTLKGIPVGYRAYRFTGAVLEEDHVKLFKIVNDDSIWVSDGLRRRPLRSWPLVELVYGANPPIIEVGSVVELDDAAGPVDVVGSISLTPSRATTVSGTFVGAVG